MRRSRARVLNQVISVRYTWQLNFNMTEKHLLPAHKDTTANVLRWQQQRLIKWNKKYSIGCMWWTDQQMFLMVFFCPSLFGSGKDAAFTCSFSQTLTVYKYPQCQQTTQKQQKYKCKNIYEKGSKTKSSRKKQRHQSHPCLSLWCMLLFWRKKHKSTDVSTSQQPPPFNE